MIFITVKFTIHPDKEAEMMKFVDEYTRGVRDEPGNVFFEWSRSLDNPDQFVLLEAFRDSDAGAAHVNTDHAKKAFATLPDLVRTTPDIIYVEVDQDNWGPMAEVTPKNPS